jgi:hypothetical protein
MSQEIANSFKEKFDEVIPGNEGKKTVLMPMISWTQFARDVAVK